MLRAGLTSETGSKLTVLSDLSLFAEENPLELLVRFPVAAILLFSPDLNSFNLFNMDPFWLTPLTAEAFWFVVPETDTTVGALGMREFGGVAGLEALFGVVIRRDLSGGHFRDGMVDSGNGMLESSLWATVNDLKSQ